MQMKPGNRLRSAVDDTELIVVKASNDDVDLRCGGQPVIAHTEGRADGSAPDPAYADGTEIGKRYTDTDATLEVLCTKGGSGSLSIGDEPLVLKGAKPLPSSD